VADTASTSGDPVADAVRSVRDTAKWVVAGLAGVATALAAGSQLSSIGSLDLGWRLAVAVVAAVTGLMTVGAGIWITVDMLLPTQVGLAELADSKNSANGDVRRYIADHRELLQGQAENVEALKAKYDSKLADRDKKYAAARANIKDEAAVAAANAANAEVVYLASVVQKLLGFAVLQQVRLGFVRWRNKMAVIAIVTAVALLAFAWSANPPKAISGASTSGATLSTGVYVPALSGANVELPSPLVTHADQA